MHAAPRAQLLFPKFFTIIWGLGQLECYRDRVYFQIANYSGIYIFLRWILVRSQRAVRKMRGQNSGCLSGFPCLPYPWGLASCQMTITQREES
jgi:hypothetical protein